MIGAVWGLDCEGSYRRDGGRTHGATPRREVCGQDRKDRLRIRALVAGSSCAGSAARGLRYTNFHTTALCSPTRACLLTEALKSKPPVPGKSVDVVNGAIPGYGLLEEIKFLEEHGARYRPDLILLMLIPNDVPQHPQPPPPPLFVPTALRGVRVLRLLETL